MKKLRTHKRKLKGNENNNMGRNVSEMIGASINLMHMNEYCIPCWFGRGCLGEQLIFPADFYILDMEEGSLCITVPVTPQFSSLKYISNLGIS
ncbi:hypothetical protein Lal_00042388 [Lupinus albus]|nr:hypothetical protein Lal_00042388 [Lupinus albus]